MIYVFVVFLGFGDIDGIFLFVFRGGGVWWGAGRCGSLGLFFCFYFKVILRLYLELSFCMSFFFGVSRVRDLFLVYRIW